MLCFFKKVGFYNNISYNDRNKDFEFMFLTYIYTLADLCKILGR